MKEYWPIADVKSALSLWVYVHFIDNKTHHGHATYVHKNYITIVICRVPAHYSFFLYIYIYITFRSMFDNAKAMSMTHKADYRFVSSQSETELLCNDVSHWLGTRLASSLIQYTAHVSGCPSLTSWESQKGKLGRRNLGRLNSFGKTCAITITFFQTSCQK